MKIREGNEWIKVLVASALSIGLFSAAFIGANNLTLALDVNKIERSSLTTVFIDIPAESIPPDDFQKPTLTVYEIPNELYPVSATALSSEKAAELGAQYIWEVYGESIDGKYVDMFYFTHPSTTKAY